MPIIGGHEHDLPFVGDDEHDISDSLAVALLEEHMSVAF
jgi:hypothetical protein